MSSPPKNLKTRRSNNVKMNALIASIVSSKGIVARRFNRAKRYDVEELGVKKEYGCGLKLWWLVRVSEPPR